ncbi:MAG: hypothetical protein PHI91_01200 [Candidatus Pacebacteria bacterium]|nr:hypothetical protein [Candidatus Paceibacterota bacterium]MDD3969800.1 hypothetical protein [Candidatus Paceibacterota bacterium]MDD4738109.1 hypothetical protein [Candidatus Paceibacterota bacterium]
MKDKIKTKKEYIVFDSLRDNNGKGIKAKDLIKILKNVNRRSKN